jgi:hypothetical protein
MVSVRPMAREPFAQYQYAPSKSGRCVTSSACSVVQGLGRSRPLLVSSPDLPHAQIETTKIATAATPNLIRRS